MSDEKTEIIKIMKLVLEDKSKTTTEQICEVEQIITEHFAFEDDLLKDIQDISKKETTEDKE